MNNHFCVARRRYNRSKWTNSSAAIGGGYGTNEEIEILPRNLPKLMSNSDEVMEWFLHRLKWIYPEQMSKQMVKNKKPNTKFYNFLEIFSQF